MLTKAPHEMLHTASGQVSPDSEQWQKPRNETQRIEKGEGNVRNNETTASGQDVGGGDAAGRTPARPGETGSQDDDDAALGQKHPSTGEIIYTMSVLTTYSLHADASQSSHSDAALAPMGIVQREEGADKNLLVPADPRKGRSGTKEQAACGPRKGDAGRASTCRIQVFPPYDRRSEFCWNADRREAFDFLWCQLPDVAANVAMQFS